MKVAFDNYRFIFFGFLYSLRIHMYINFGETFHRLKTKIWREVTKVNLLVNHDLNNRKNVAATVFILSIVPEGYLVSWYQWVVFFLQLINCSYMC